MPTHVYANNNEVASKAADGKSIAAFPDVCFSPPAPPVGPIPLPYPNTGEVKDTDSGTAKVFIKDKMSGMAGDSYMTKSMGDEPATQNFNKGIITGALQGKCYFGLWSMDVNMEGKGVPRHLDMVTHNHGSMGGDTGPNPVQISPSPKAAVTSNGPSSSTSNQTIQIVSLDLFRQNRNNNTIKYVGSCLNEDEVYINLKDADLVTNNHLVQYVNLDASKLTREVALPNIQKYTNNNSPQIIPSLSQVGNKISIRVRFNCKGKHSFELSMTKKTNFYSNTEIKTNQTIYPDVLCYLSGNKYNIGDWIRFTTNNDGYFIIDFKLDMSFSLYTISAKYGGTTTKICLESWRKLFVRTFVLNSFSTGSKGEISCINDSMKKTIEFYCEHGIDIEHLGQIQYSENDIYTERISNNGNVKYGMMLNGITYGTCTSLFEAVNTILSRESTNNNHKDYSIDIFFAHYYYMCSIKNKTVKNMSINKKNKAILILTRNDEKHFVNPNITSTSPIIEIFICFGNIKYHFKFTNNTSVAIEETQKTISLKYAVVSDTKIELMPCAKLIEEIRKNKNKFLVSIIFVNPSINAGFSINKSWRAVFASLYPQAIKDYNHKTIPNLSHRTQWLPSIIAHEIAHRLGLVPDGKQSNTGTIVLDKSSTSSSSSPEHCISTSCLMYHQIVETPSTGNSMKPACSNCRDDFSRVDLRVALPDNLPL